MTMTTEAMVRGLLAEHPNLDAEAIQVSVIGDTAILRGRVRTQREREEAEAIARQVRVVQTVENRLVVTGEPI